MLRIAVATSCDALAQKISKAFSKKTAITERFESFEHCVSSLANLKFDLIAFDYSNQRIEVGALLQIERYLSKSIPTIAIVSDSHLEQSVQLLNAGVDRCLPLSFDEKHFGAIVRALTRRRIGLTSSVTQYGTLSFNHDSKRIFVEGVEVELTSRESQVLEVLLKRVGQLTPKETFIEEMGEGSIDLQSSAVEVYIHRLRRKISPDVLPVRNIKRCGYLLPRFTPALIPADQENRHRKSTQLGLGMSL